MNKRLRVIFIFLGLPMIIFISWILIPIELPIANTHSRLVLDSDKNILRVTLAEDGQYRFPPSNKTLPEKYIKSLLSREDKRFYSHWGVDPFALSNALYANLTKGERVRGGSTITMQVARLWRPKKRTYVNKIIECLYAVKFSWHFEKKQILEIYASQVPMGGNLVGIETASQKYFNKSANHLTWAEAALFSVLPHNPSLINLERGRLKLKEKRNNLLKKLWLEKIISKSTYHVSIKEGLPTSKQKFPFHAPHFSEYVLNKTDVNINSTFLINNIHQRVQLEVEPFSRELKRNGINNLSVLVVETQTGKVRSYVGNPWYGDSANHGQVDGVQSYRSTGSLLKPFLAGLSMDRGPFNLKSRIKDIPTYYGTFTPQNANKTFSGLVSLEETLIRSLNVPSIRLHHYYGLHDFYQFLKDSGLKNLFRTPEDYGLSLILGGAEASLWELTQMYVNLGNLGKSVPMKIFRDKKSNSESEKLYSPGTAWLILETLKNLSRPGIENYFGYFTQQIPVAWKTGTSYGYKDGWAIGTNAQWTIGVWVGNFNGEGNGMLTGAKAAGPILFSLFNQLTEKDGPTWIQKPIDLDRKKICNTSGFYPTAFCPSTSFTWVPSQAYRAKMCPFHKNILVDKKSGYQVGSHCWNLKDTTWKTKTIYPASVHSILKKSGYQVEFEPQHNPKCKHVHVKSNIDILYPAKDISIWVPRNKLGEYESIVFKANYTGNTRELYWYLNNQFMGETLVNHSLLVNLKPGDHRLTVQDSEGSRAFVNFKAVRRGI